MRITVVGVLIVVGGILLIAAILYASGKEQNKPVKVDEQPKPNEQ